MCVNWGNLDLLMNFLRSACDKGVDVRNLVVFAADPKVEAALKAIGVLVFSHPALGSFAATAARSYGDHTFVEMMWLKLTCVTQRVLKLLQRGGRALRTPSMRQRLAYMAWSSILVARSTHRSSPTQVSTSRTL